LPSSLHRPGAAFRQAALATKDPMSMQAALEGFEAPATPTDRLFFALVPDQAAARRALTLAEALGHAQGAKPRQGALEKFHITVFHVGDFAGWPQQVVAQAQEAAAQLLAEPFDIGLDTLKSFGGSPRRLPCVLLPSEPPAALMAFQAAMQACMLRRGLTQGHNLNRPYTPHLTLLYGHQRIEAQPLMPPLCWTAREFVLIRSLIGQGRYEQLGRWALTGAPG